MIQSFMQQRNPEQQQNNYFSQLLRQQSPEQEGEYTPQLGQGLGGGGGGLMNVLRQRESGGNYGIQNTLGYAGAYQFGAKALEDTGLLRPGAGRLGNKGLNNENNWTIPGGKRAFLASPELQDMAMQRLMERNKDTMTRMGLINEATPPGVINGLLAAAHIAGPGGAKKLMQGRNPRDAYGTGAAEYFRLGMQSD
jgi:hypothetical protein